MKIRHVAIALASFGSALLLVACTSTIGPSQSTPQTLQPVRVTGTVTWRRTTCTAPSRRCHTKPVRSTACRAASRCHARVNAPTSSGPSSAACTWMKYASDPGVYSEWNSIPCCRGVSG